MNSYVSHPKTADLMVIYEEADATTRQAVLTWYHQAHIVGIALCARALIVRRHNLLDQYICIEQVTGDNAGSTRP